MEIIVIGVVIMAGLVLGMLVGIRLENLMHAGRERRLGAERRLVNERARALDAYEGVRALLDQARTDPRALDAVERHDLTVLLAHERLGHTVE